MRRTALLACTMLASLLLAAADAGAQAAADGGKCSVAEIDAARYGAGPVYRDCDVDRAAKLKKQSRPRADLPDDVPCAIAELEFAVDETGRPVEGTALVVETNLPALAEATARSLGEWRYEPAMKGGAAVRQAVRARVARSNEKRPFVVARPGERPPPRKPEPLCA